MASRLWRNTPLQAGFDSLSAFLEERSAQHLAHQGPQYVAVLNFTLADPLDLERTGRRRNSCRPFKVAALVDSDEGEEEETQDQSGEQKQEHEQPLKGARLLLQASGGCISKLGC